MKELGLNEVWNSAYLNNAQQQQGSSQSQQQQPPNAIAQNKARLELIIYHLTILRYSNIPKPNILQTMTTPKNWTQMLQILYFLCNNCWVMKIY
jgi:hypothetical protein